jgi:transglutaminase-like putative cysteine protease
MWRRWDRRRVTITATTARTRDAVAIGRTLIAAGIVVAIAFVSSVAATNAVPPTGERLVLRSAIIQPFDPRDYVSPLIGFRNYEQPDSIAQAMLTVSGLPNGARIRIATLDSYDGVVYSVGGASASFTRVPSSVDQSGVHGTPVRLTITIDRYAGVWLPVVGQLKTVEFSGPNAQKLRDSFYYDNTSGAAAAVSAVAAGDRYTLAAVLPVQPSSTQLPSLTPGSAEVPPVAVVPDQLPAVLDRYVTAADTPGRRLAAMIDGLKADGYLSHGLSGETPSRSGHSAERITELLTGQRMIGDQEQYAVTAALMARQLGFPARVVVGFAPASAASATATAAAGAITTVVGGDISAWIEVNTAQYGWVTIDPTPAIRPIPVTKPQEPAQVARPQSPVQPQLQEPDKRNAQLPPGSLRDNPAQPNPFLAVLFQVLGVLGWSALALMVVISPFLVIAVAKLRRRILRSRAPTPVRRISGGWQEFEDSIIDYGYLPARAATRSEVARVVGGSQPLALASVVDRAVFSPDRSDAVAADAVWRAVSELRASLARRATRRQRITAVFSVRSLGGTGMRNRVKE